MYSHAEGRSTLAGSNNNGPYAAHAEGEYTIAASYGCHAEGGCTSVDGTPLSNYSPESGVSISGSYALGYNSHAEGCQTYAKGYVSHAEGFQTITSGNYSHAEGYQTTASGPYSHAEGHATASGNYSHAEGYETTASGNYAHAEGYNAWAAGDYSHAEGYQTLVSGPYSHAEGLGTMASGQVSHASGNGTIASKNNQCVIGTYNVSDYDAPFIIGDGTSDSSRSNAMVIDWKGNIRINAVDGQSWVNGLNSYFTTPDTFNANAGGERAAITIMNQPSDSWYYPWIRQRAKGLGYAIGVLPTSEAVVIAAKTLTETSNDALGDCHWNANGRLYQHSYKGAESQCHVSSGAGAFYMYAQGTSGGNLGLYRADPSGMPILTIVSGGTVTVHNTSDRRYKIDKGLLNSQEAYNILSEIPVINFVYKEDEDKNNLEQSGVYAQDLRDILLKYNYKNKNYLQVFTYADDPAYDGMEKKDQEELMTQPGDITPKFSYDLTIPEEEVRLYQMNYEALIPLLVKGWQIHEQEIKELKEENALLIQKLEEIENKINTITDI